VSSIFAGWRPHTVDVVTPTATDEWGADTGTTHAGVPCLIEDGAKTVITTNGMAAVSSARVHVELEHAAWFPLGAAVTVRGVVRHVVSLSIVDDFADFAGATVALL
jgi:hypothetical protein